MSDLSSSIKEKKRFILRNPDGTYIACIKTGEKDSANEKLNNNKQEEDSLTISDDELQFIIENYDQFDYNVVMRHFLETFRAYRLLYFIFFMAEMFLTSFLMFITWQKRESTILMVID